MNLKFWRRGWLAPRKLSLKEEVENLKHGVKALDQKFELLADLLRLDGRPRNAKLFGGMVSVPCYFGDDHTIDLGKGVVRTMSEEKRVVDSTKKKGK